MAKERGRCLLVNNQIRQELFLDRFDRLITEAGLKVIREEIIDYDRDKFKVYVLTH